MTSASELCFCWGWGAAVHSKLGSVLGAHRPLLTNTSRHKRKHQHINGLLPFSSCPAPSAGSVVCATCSTPTCLRSWPTSPSACASWGAPQTWSQQMSTQLPSLAARGRREQRSWLEWQQATAAGSGGGGRLQEREPVCGGWSTDGLRWAELPGDVCMSVCALCSHICAWSLHVVVGMCAAWVWLRAQIQPKIQDWHHPQSASAGRLSFCLIVLAVCHVWSRAEPG